MDIYISKQGEVNGPFITNHILMEIAEILPDGFNIYVDYSKTGDFIPVERAEDPSQSYIRWYCMESGLGEEDIFGIDVAKDMTAGLEWGRFPENGSGPNRYVSLGIESVTVPAGTFEAVKIQEGVNTNTADSFHWYVPGIGEVKTYYTPARLGVETTIELVSYLIPR